MVRQACRWLVVMGAVLSSLEAYRGDQGDSLMGLAHPEGFTASPKRSTTLRRLSRPDDAMTAARRALSLAGEGGDGAAEPVALRALGQRR